MIALVLSVACKPPEVPLRTWRGEEVAAHKAAHIALDDAPWTECSPPGDDDLIMRLMQAEAGLYVEENGLPGAPYEFRMGLSGVSTVNSYASTWVTPTPKVQGAYEVSTSVWYWDLVEHVYADIQTEQRYDVGLDWPGDPHLYYTMTEHNLAGSIEEQGGYNCLSIGSSEPWDEDLPVYDPFYPFQVCTARIRPDRFQGTFWFDVSETEWHSPEVSSPVYLVWDVSNGQYDNFFSSTSTTDVGKESVEFNFASTTYAHTYGPRWANRFHSSYYDDLSESDLFPATDDEG